MRLVIVGFISALPHLDHFPPDSVVLVDEPDVLRKMGVHAAMAAAPTLHRIVPWEYQLPGAADGFADAHPDLRPDAVAPLVEYAVPFAARLAERFGLPSAGSAAASTLRDKALLRRVTREAGVPNPLSEEVSSADEVRAFMAAVAGPVIVKPADRQASVGTEIITDESDVDRVWSVCADQDEGPRVPDRVRQARMLVEQYVSGPEYSVEMLARDGEPLFTNITAKSLFPGGRPVERAHTVPADLTPAEAEALAAATRSVLAAVAFGTGIVHCEWIVHDGVPHLVECAGRFPGDGVPELIERAYPMDLAGIYYALMRGDTPPPIPTAAAHGATVRFLSASPGTVTSVTGLAEARALPGVLRATVGVDVGDEVRPLLSSWDRVGSITVVADAPGESAAVAAKAASLVEVRTTG